MAKNYEEECITNSEYIKQQLSAEKNRDDIIRLAEEERERIISDAKHNASVIVNDALMEAQKIEFKTDLLETKLKMLKKKINKVLEAQKTVIEEVENIAKIEE